MCKSQTSYLKFNPTIDALLKKCQLSASNFPNSPNLVHLNEANLGYLSVCRECVQPENSEQTPCLPGSPHLKCSSCFQYFPQKSQFEAQTCCAFCNKIQCQAYTSRCLYGHRLRTFQEFFDIKKSGELDIRHFRGNQLEREKYEEFLKEAKLTLADVCSAFELMLQENWEGHGKIKNLAFRIDQEILEVVDKKLFFARNRKLFMSSELTVLEAGLDDSACSDCLEELFGVFLVLFKEGVDFGLTR